MQAWILTGQMSAAMADQFEEYSSVIEERSGKSALPGLTSTPKDKVRDYEFCLHVFCNV